VQIDCGLEEILESVAAPAPTLTGMARRWRAAAPDLDRLAQFRL